MADLQDEEVSQLVERLSRGFGAVLQQVQELASKNTELERRLARIREEAHYSTRSDGPLSLSAFPAWLPPKRDGCTKSSCQSRSKPEEEQPIMKAEDQETTMAIADGVEAWKKLSQGKECRWRRYNGESLHEQRSRDAAGDSSRQNFLPDGHLVVDQEVSENAKCPFVAMSQLGQRGTAKMESSEMRRPDSLPTPPHTQEHFADAIHEDTYDRHDSPPPSISGSISKCPIRMLDERSPEEIAKFFEDHKHEIPRSHEICVRRYQSDSQTIRQLDAKYGNLANMIKGLGVKHQPLLPSKEDVELENAAMDPKSMQKVEKWANNVDTIDEGADMSNDHKPHLTELDDMQGHFDRPLKEIRVGESPSRPWGIPVPAAIPHLSLNEDTSTPTPRGTQTKTRDVHAGDRAKTATSHGKDESMGDKSRMLFTGPVFIGYGPEQAAALIRDCNLQPQAARV